MADRTEALVLRMEAQYRSLEKALDAAHGITRKKLGAIESRFDRMNQNIRRSGDQMARDLRSSIAAIGVGIAIREVTQYADVWTTAQNKLAAAGVEQGKVNGTLKDLVTLARSTRSGLEGTVDLYAKLTRAGQQLNLTQDQVRKITETTLQAFVAGGAAASEQAAAITQLSQALGSGVLQGDELRSIRENAPLLAQAIADEFNTTIAGLKELGAEGQLTADRVARAILNADGITDAFGKTVETVAQAMENLRTEFTRYIAESRIAQTVVQTLGGFIEFVTDNLDLLADAAIVAATVIGGTLAAGAIARFVAALRTMVVSMGAATAGMQRLRIAATFFTGPIGAILLGVGAALFTMATNAQQSASAAEAAQEAFDGFGKTQADIVSDTAALETAQNRLNEAIVRGGVEAQRTATMEVDAIRKRLEANKALSNLYLAQATNAVNMRSAEYRTRNVDLPFLSDEQREALGAIPGGVGQLTLEQMEDILVRELRSRGMSRDEFSQYLATATQSGTLSERDSAMLSIAVLLDQYRAEMAALDKQLADTKDAISQLTFDTGPILEFPEFEAGKGAAGVRGFRTELEQLVDTLRDLRAAREADADATEAAIMARDSYADNADASARKEDEYFRTLADLDSKIKPYQDAEGANALERSREAVQAILNYAQSGAIAEAFAQVPSISDLLVGDDEQLLMAELRALATAAADEVSVGVDKMAADFKKAFEDIEKARAAAIAAGETDLRRFDAAAQDLFDTLDRDLEARVAVEGLEEVEPIVDIPDFAVEGEEFRQIMRDAVKSAMRDGIRTGDWDEAFAAILAEAVTTGLDAALNRIGDWLADFLFAPDGFLGGLINGAGNWAASMIVGGRPTGGGVGANRGYRVNDRADGGEFLFMGSNPGQVLRASDLNGMMNGARSSGGTVIDASMTVMGSIDSVTWPKLQAAMAQQRQVIMSAVPGAVQATLTFNRMQKKRV